ncbi:proline dehydrogenase [Nitzschia inconspicua]|uniref:Proline dehydrogenase n=1 Tax=Nitzschia inconspicua TaxID=303405 RepID=A0A9K3LY39_9STRA|nr:proline dehydrogenase [Nitzschia inconspicua]
MSLLARHFIRTFHRNCGLIRSHVRPSLSNCCHGPVREKSSFTATYEGTSVHSNASDSRNNTSTPKNPVPDFNDAHAAYESKSTKELLRAAACFRLCRIPFLVNNAESLLRSSRFLLGGWITDAALKTTLFGHFCAGEDQDRIRPVIQKLKDAGIGSILDYAAENDQPAAPAKLEDKSFEEQNIRVQTYDYESEAQCDRHVDTFLHCINDVASFGPDGFAAVKITALGNPKLLARLSTAIVEAKRLFQIFDSNGDGVIGRDEFEFGYNKFFVDGETRIKEIFEEFDPDNSGMIDYITWSMMLSPRDLPRIVSSCQAAGRLSEACPTGEEIELLENMYDRGRTLGEAAAKAGVRLLIDAEQVRYQPAIDNLVLELQRQFNVDDKPIIYNTYQCYLQDSPERLRTDVKRAERFNYHFGAKLVRGAYMESERKLAEDAGLPDPIQPNIDATHKCYDESVDFLLRHSIDSDQKAELMCATHNQSSIENAIDAMNKYGVDRKASTICFAQLYGMSDHLSYNLGKHDFRVFKYVPYGEVHEVMPYLLRRARENSAIVGGATLELNMIKQELGSRMRRLG